MASCNYNDLLADGKCFVPLPTYIQQAIALQLWCDISDAITPVPPIPPGGLWNPEEPGLIENPETGEPLVNPES